MTLSRLRRTRGDDGAAAVELALVLPFLLLVGVAAAPFAVVASTSAHIVEVSESVARYATRAERDPARGDVARYRPTSTEVEQYAADVADVPVSVTVTPDPSTAHPGDLVTVTIRTSRSLGPLAAAANGLASLVRQDHPFPEGAVDISSTVVMREE